MPGGFSAASLKYSSLIFLAASILQGIVEPQASGLAESGSARPLEEFGVSQRDTAKRSAFASTSSTDRMGNHYLMLVNTAMAKQMDASKMAQFDRSPYEGLAVSFVEAFDNSPVPLPGAMEAQITSWKKSTTKQIWPWVYLNRMIGANDTEGNQLSKVPYFQRFQG